MSNNDQKPTSAEIAEFKRVARECGIERRTDTSGEDYIHVPFGVSVDMEKLKARGFDKHL